MPMNHRLLRPIASGFTPVIDCGNPFTLLARLIDGGVALFTGPLVVDGGTP